MSLTLREYTLGQLANNSYLLADTQTNQAVLIDPPMGVSEILQDIQADGWQLSLILLTHAHFDHTYGIYELQDQLPSLPPIALHLGDANLYRGGGLGELMGLYRNPLPPVQRWLEDGDNIQLGEYVLRVVHCPGHTPGHVFFHSTDLNTAFVGDIIFRRGIGRTCLLYTSPSPRD